MKRIISKPCKHRDYARLLKDYFGFHLLGLEIKVEGGQVQAQVVYTDFKHIDTVRRELAQMMPEVEFIKLRRDYTDSAILWVLEKLMWEEGFPNSTHRALYVQRDEDTLSRTSIRDIAYGELCQLELEDSDDIKYRKEEKKLYDDKKLQENVWP